MSVRDLKFEIKDCRAETLIVDGVDVLSQSSVSGVVISSVVKGCGQVTSVELTIGPQCVASQSADHEPRFIEVGENDGGTWVRVDYDRFKPSHFDCVDTPNQALKRAYGRWRRELEQRVAEDERRAAAGFEPGGFAAEGPLKDSNGGYTAQMGEFTLLENSPPSAVYRSPQPWWRRFICRLTGTGG